MSPRKQKPTEAQTILMARHILIGWFGPDDVLERRRSGVSSFFIPSRDLVVALLIGAKHGWHWPDETPTASDTEQTIRNRKLRKEMRDEHANLVCIWDEELDELLLWLAMGAPDGRDWETEYSWIPDRDLHPNRLGYEWRNPSRMTPIVKHYQHDVIFARELALWRENRYLDKRNDKRRIRGALYANRYHYVDKTPDMLSDAEIIRGLRIAGYVTAYSSYDARPLADFLKTHPDVKSVCDPCAGWGERMLACAAANVAYVGYDVNDALSDGYAKMMSDLPIQHVAFANADAADVSFKHCDAFVCCPPYGDIEHYSAQGAENLDTREFDAWWRRVCSNMSQVRPRYICITSNQKYRDTFIAPLLEAGYSIQSETPVKRSKASHFQRKPNVSLKKEHETFIVLCQDESR